MGVVVKKFVVEVVVYFVDYYVFVGVNLFDFFGY